MDVTGYTLFSLVFIYKSGFVKFNFSEYAGTLVLNNLPSRSSLLAVRKNSFLSGLNQTSGYVFYF